MDSIQPEGRIEASDPSTHANIVASAAVLQVMCFGLARQSGWHNGPIADNALRVPTRLMLTVSELGEAMEGHRTGAMDQHLPHRPSVEVECADAVIRLFDLAGAEGWDLAGAIAEKLAYNQRRADHKPENRVKAGGKLY